MTLDKEDVRKRIAWLLREQELFARAPIALIKAKVFLFHAVVKRNLRASVKSIGAEF